MNSKKVFISYCREDIQFAKKLRLRMNALEIQTWLDVKDLGLGESWRPSLDDALRSAYAVVVVMSRDAIRSPYVNYEWAFARGAGAKVIPLKIDKSKFSGPISAIQYVDFTQRGKNWLRLFDALGVASVQKEKEQEPRLVAEFEVDDSGKPKRIGREYVILLSLKGMPSDTEKVIYRIHDKTFKKRKWTEHNRDESFATWMSSYGDILLSVEGKSPSSQISMSATLFDSLRRTYLRNHNPDIKKALHYIQEH